MSNATQEKRCYLPTLIASELKDIAVRMDVLHEEKVALIRNAVGNCEHPLEAIYEKPFVHHGWMNSEEPWLICSRCGYTEQGWGSGYKKLRHADYQNVPQITTEVWREMRTVMVKQN